MGAKVTSSQTVNKTSLPTQNVPLTPEAELHLLVGSAYGEGDTESPYGHTAVYIKLKGQDYIYDFGRYGKVKPEKFGWITLEGASSPRGEGVLRVWNNFQAYIADENRQGLNSARSRTTYGYGYKIFDNQASKVIAYYNNLIKTAKPARETAHYKSYILAQDYFALGPNCTTQSLEAARQAVPDIVKNSERFINPDKVLPVTAKAAFKLSNYETPSFIFLPDNLNDYLKTAPAIRIDMKNTYKSQKK